MSKSGRSPTISSTTITISASRSKASLEQRPIRNSTRRDAARRGNTVYNITSRHNPAYKQHARGRRSHVDGGTLVTLQNNLVHEADYGIELASENKGKATTWVWALQHRPSQPTLRRFTRRREAAGQWRHDGLFRRQQHALRERYDDIGLGRIADPVQRLEQHDRKQHLQREWQGSLFNAFANSPTPASMNHNLYFSPDGATGSQWIWLGVSYGAFARFQSATERTREENSPTRNSPTPRAAISLFPPLRRPSRRRHSQPDGQRPHRLCRRAAHYVRTIHAARCSTEPNPGSTTSASIKACD